MYDLDKFVKDAIRTESVVKEFKVDPELLTSVMQLFIASGNMLDQIKKHAFYGKAYDTDKFVNEFVNIVGTLDQLKGTISNGLTADKEVVVDVNTRLAHAMIGAATEGVELIEAFAKNISGEELDATNILEEMGDQNWYHAIAHDELNADYGQTMDTIIAKLKARYPEKFTSEEAINRDLTKEREILENGTTKTKKEYPY